MKSIIAISLFLFVLIGYQNCGSQLEPTSSGQANTQDMPTNLSPTLMSMQKNNSSESISCNSNNEQEKVLCSKIQSISKNNNTGALEFRGWACMAASVNQRPGDASLQPFVWATILEPSPDGDPEKDIYYDYGAVAQFTGGALASRENDEAMISHCGESYQGGEFFLQIPQEGIDAMENYFKNNPSVARGSIFNITTFLLDINSGIIDLTDEFVVGFADTLPALAIHFNLFEIPSIKVGYCQIRTFPVGNVSKVQFSSLDGGQTLNLRLRNFDRPSDWNEKLEDGTLKRDTTYLAGGDQSVQTSLQQCLDNAPTELDFFACENNHSLAHDPRDRNIVSLEGIEKGSCVPFSIYAVILPGAPGESGEREFEVCYHTTGFIEFQTPAGLAHKYNLPSKWPETSGDCWIELESY